MSDDLELFAYVDGELDAARAQAFEARMAGDPALAAEVARYKALRATLSEAYAPILDAKVPDHLIAAVSAPVVVRPSGGHLPQWAAMAACLVVGVLAGWTITSRGPLNAQADGRLAARGALAQALSVQLAAEDAGRVVQVGLSFKTAQGDYCRTFQSARDRLAGVACHEDGRWIARLTTTYAPPASSAAYRTAASSTPPAVLAAVDSMIMGDPLDQDAERAARAAGW